MKVACVANEVLEPELVEAARKICSLLGVELTLLNSPEGVENFDLIIDWSPDVEEPKLISVEQLGPSLKASLHDFDLAFYLLLKRKLGAQNLPRLLVLPQKIRGEVIKKAQKILFDPNSTGSASSI